ncbi:tetratricopeptide repeat protein [Flavobacterium hibernum]|uniref:Cytochrome C biosynthesis protein n=1 Tax=Flavobacterium hibernum TaxID=37752 RepID=A0A0D0EJL6_9FLAO|nr:tetratricopeptide repeat protein [Flavobacterium hibernum]KIO51160.1 cytochrome C biosynthesis protein [Flavobacterium hibernum]OXA86226.1 cytochrome C biosynthesis protein [Flavobacterium hibernum]STO14523.1 tetratricopeptide repeat protein [Flavobacterium hibernum]
MIQKGVIVILFFVLLGNTTSLMAQTEPEDIAMATDEYQDSFYESLKQKGIENYDKAIVSLEKCIKLKPNDAVAYFELGKNYLFLKQYKEAQDSFEKATQLDPKNKWYWLGIYDVSFQTKNYPLAIQTIQKIIPFDEEYKDDLISLYMITNQFEKALATIIEMDAKFGKSDDRNRYKMQIISQGNFQNTEINNLINQIKQNPKEESNYVDLIFLYSKANEADKALDVAKQLAKEVPTSEWGQVSLFKTYLDSNQADKAIKSMNVILASSKIDSKIKHRTLNEFLIYVNKNPQYSADLEKAISYFDNDPNVDVAKEIGKFYHSKGQFENAIKYYEKDLKSNSETDRETNLLLLEAYTQAKQFEPMTKRAMTMIEIYPSQPQFYYYAGLGNNQLKQFKNAKTVLEMGLDYVVDDKALEANFNIQLGEAYNGLGDAKKKEEYFLKANELLKKNK